MSFCLCQRFDIRKNGNIFVDLKNGLGFNLLWNYDSASDFKTKKSVKFELEKFKINQTIQLENIQIKYAGISKTIAAGDTLIIFVSKSGQKFIELKVCWSFAKIGSKNIGLQKSQNNDATFNSLKNNNYFCQHLLIKKNGEMFVNLKNGNGFTLIWKKYGSSYINFDKKQKCVIFEFQIMKQSKEIEIDKMDFTYANLTHKMEPGKSVLFEMFEDKPKWIKLDIFWRFKNSEIQNPDDKKDTKFADLILEPYQSFQKSKLDDEKNLKFQFFNDIFASKKYYDVIFYTNDSKKVFAHRCILYKYSDIFMAFFDTDSTTPIEIEVDFSEATVTQALQFCYGKIDGIQKFGIEIIKFAEKYEINGLKKTFLQSLNNETLTVENISEIVIIAFNQNYTLLKQKCLKFILQNKTKIGADKLSKLPMEIIVSTLLSF